MADLEAKPRFEFPYHGGAAEVNGVVGLMAFATEEEFEAALDAFGARGVRGKLPVSQAREMARWIERRRGVQGRSEGDGSE